MVNCCYTSTSKMQDNPLSAILNYLQWPSILEAVFPSAAWAHAMQWWLGLTYHRTDNRTLKTVLQYDSEGFRDMYRPLEKWLRSQTGFSLTSGLQEEEDDRKGTMGRIFLCKFFTLKCSTVSSSECVIPQTQYVTIQNMNTTQEKLEIIIKSHVLHLCKQL
jgi:hypothetical protein